MKPAPPKNLLRLLPTLTEVVQPPLIKAMSLSVTDQALAEQLQQALTDVLNQHLPDLAPVQRQPLEQAMHQAPPAGCSAAPAARL